MTDVSEYYNEPTGDGSGAKYGYRICKYNSPRIEDDGNGAGYLSGGGYCYNSYGYGYGDGYSGGYSIIYSHGYGCGSGELAKFYIHGHLTTRRRA